MGIQNDTSVVMKLFIFFQECYIRTPDILQQYLYDILRILFKFWILSEWDTGVMHQ